MVCLCEVTTRDVEKMKLNEKYIIDVMDNEMRAHHFVRSTGERLKHWLPPKITDSTQRKTSVLSIFIINILFTQQRSNAAVLPLAGGPKNSRTLMFASKRMGMRARVCVCVCELQQCPFHQFIVL